MQVDFSREINKIQIKNVSTMLGCSGIIGGRFSSPSLLQFWLSFSASAKIFFSRSKSKLNVLRGISPTCVDN